MKIRPELRALPGDDAPQRQAQARMREAAEAWRARPEVAAVLAAVYDYAAGSALADCAALAQLFTRPGEGASFAADFAAAQARAIAAEPLGHVALRHFTDGVLSTLLLAREGGVTLTLVAIDGAELAAQPEPVSVNFAPCEAVELVLAGSAAAEMAELRGDTLARRAVGLSAGAVVRRDGAWQALLVRRIEGRLVSLRLQRRRPDAGPSREYELATGRLVHQAAGDPRESRTELMLALLGRMKRADAAPLMAAIAGENGSPSLRWQALRECLALDSAAGFAALCAVARSPADPLAAPAGALRAQLLEAYPALAAVEACPA